MKAMVRLCRSAPSMVLAKNCQTNSGAWSNNLTKRLTPMIISSKTAHTSYRFEREFHRSSFHFHIISSPSNYSSRGTLIIFPWFCCSSHYLVPFSIPFQSIFKTSFKHMPYGCSKRVEEKDKIKKKTPIETNPPFHGIHRIVYVYLNSDSHHPPGRFADPHRTEAVGASETEGKERRKKCMYE